MAELTPKEHLQPSLLDRITDLNPASKTDTTEERVISLRRLRESVIRDLEWLLNTGCLQTSLELNDYPEVRRSVLNYGVPDISGVSAGSKDNASIEREIRQAIIDFEPRILPGTLKVDVAIDHTEMSINTVTLQIQGELWWQPLPERFYLKAVLDPELGKFRKAVNSDL
jgi:type VI secretion system protein ImpF